MPSLCDGKTVCDVIRRWAEIQPDAPAFVAEGAKPLTYRGLLETMDGVRLSLRAAGAGNNDRIAVLHPGGAEMAAALTGVMSSAIAVPLNPASTAGEFAFLLKDRRIDALLLAAGKDTPARAAATHLRLPVIELQSDPQALGAIQVASVTAAGSTEADADWPKEDDLAIILATTGTSGRMKVVPKRHRHVRFMAQMIVDTCALAPEDRVLLLQPLIYSSGFHLMMSALLSGGSIIFMPEFEVEKFFRILSVLEPTWVTGSHTFHRAIHAHAAQYPEAVAGSKLRLLRTSSGFLQPRIADDLERIFGVPVLESYGSTEAGRLTANPLPPRKAKRGTGGVRLSQKVEIRGPDGTILPPGEIGEIVAKVERAFEGYEDDPEANAAAFDDGWFRTGDEGYFDEDGFLMLTGRVSEMINRGGEKVSPAEVDAAMMAHPNVREAAAFPIPHPTLGEEVAAAIVQAPGAALTDETLTRFLVKRLSGFKVPRRFFFVDTIPKSDAGKVQRHRLPEILGVGAEAADPRRAEAPDRDPTPLEGQLLPLWAKALKLPSVGLNDNFFMLGGDSLQAVEMFLEIEQKLGHRLPRAALFEAGTVAEMARLIDADTPPRCLVPIQPKGSRPPFFCVHDGNGHVLNFRDLAKHLGGDQPFYGIQCLGLDGRDMPFTDIKPMAAHYVREIKRIRPLGPYFIGGYSFGGRVAYVMAQIFRAKGDEVALLALLDSSSRMGRHRLTLTRWLKRHADRLTRIPPRMLKEYLVMRFQNLGSWLRRAALTRVYGWALSRYRARRAEIPNWLYRPVEANDLIRRTTRLDPYDGDAILFQTNESAASHVDGSNGWSTLVRGELEVVPIPGQHFQVVKEPHVGKLAEALADRLKTRVTTQHRGLPEPAGVSAAAPPGTPSASSAAFPNSE